MMRTGDWDLKADSLMQERKQTLNGEEYFFWEKAFLALLPADIPLRILDAGSGSGFISILLSKLGHSVIGIDISPNMVQCAYETASTVGQRIEYRIMDCTKMDFDNESFDAVVCCELLSILSDTKQAWSEFKRVLKKNGHIIIFETYDISTSRLMAQGFTHCRENSFEGLTALNRGDSLHCLSARKPSRNEEDTIPQVSLFGKHIQTAKKQIQLYQNWCQKIGMPYPEFTVLNMISRHKKGVRPSDISAALVIPPQTLTRILTGLQRDGYIDRKTNDRDHRSSVITITETGMEKIKPLQIKLRKIEEQSLSEYNAEEVADLCRLSNNIFKSLETTFQNQTEE